MQDSHSDAIPWAYVILLTLGAFSAFLTTTIVMVITPKLMLSLGVGTYRVAWITNIYMITSGIVVPVSGYLGDRVGMKKLFILALAVYTLGSFFCGISNNLSELLIARCIQAMGGGFLMPVTSAIIMRIVPPRRLGTAMGVRGLAVGVAPAVGPLLGAYLTDKLGWHAIFLINVPMGIIMIPLIFFVLPEVEGYKEPGMDWSGMLLSSVTIFTALLAVSEGQKVGWTSEYIVVLFTVSFFFMLLFTIWELTSERPMLDLRLLKNPVFSISISVAVMATVGMYAIIYFVPLFAETVLHYTLIETGLVLLPAGLVMGAMTMLGGILFDRVGAMPLCLGGLTFAAILTLKIAFINPDTSYSTLAWLLVLRSVGLGIALFPLAIAALYTVPRRLAGRATAINSVARMVPSAIGLAFFTFILNKEEVVHYTKMAANINDFSTASRFTMAKMVPLATIDHYMGMGLQHAFVLLEYLQVQTQATSRSIDDVIFISSFFLFVTIPFTLILTRGNMEQAKLKEEQRLSGSNSFGPSAAGGGRTGGGRSGRRPPR